MRNAKYLTFEKKKDYYAQINQLHVLVGSYTYWIIKPSLYKI